MNADNTSWGDKKQSRHCVRGTSQARWWLLPVIALLVLPAGCARDIEGGPGANQPPEVFLVNVPPDGTVSTSSLLVKWYGTDRDGRIKRFDYTVITEEDLDSIAATLDDQHLEPVERFIRHRLNDDYPFWISVFPDSVANANQDVVKLFASTEVDSCETEIIGGVPRLVNCISRLEPQYFFIRAIDDLDTSSTIKYRTFQRTNHWPSTQISRTFDQTAEYLSLPELTATYSGIDIRWLGEDRLDFPPPLVPELEFHWRIYGPYESKPTVDDTLDALGNQLDRVWESKNADTLIGVWVRDTMVDVWDLWRVADEDPNADLTVTRQGWFAVLVSARDDAFVADETPAFGTFTAIYPQFEREVLLVEDTWYNPDTYTNPACSPRNRSAECNQLFLERMLAAAYPEYVPELDMWWRHKGQSPGRPCRFARPPFNANCMNALPLKLLAQHRLVIFIDDDITDQINVPAKPPPSQLILRRYLDVGGMVWINSRHGLIRDTETSQSSPPRIIDFISGPGSQLNVLGAQYFDIEGMYYPAWRLAAIPLNTARPVQPGSNDEFIGAKSTGSAVGLPEYLPVDRTRLDSMFIPAAIKKILDDAGVEEIPGVPDVNFIVRGTEATPLYLFDSWRPQGPVPPENGPSFSHNKVVMQRMVGPNRDVPLFKTAYSTFPLYFIEEEVTRELVVGMVEWFMLPFELTP